MFLSFPYSLSFVLILLSCFNLSDALHYYSTPGQKKCFFEELPADTLVVTKFDAAIYNDETKSFDHPDNLVLALTVDETFDNNHRVVSQKSKSDSEFTFTSTDSGEHKFCLTPQYPKKDQRIRILLDMAIGYSAAVDSKKTDDVNWLTSRIHDLNGKVEEIQREQQLIREREALFRDQSESTNSRVVKWSIIQLAVLIIVGYFQLKHLKSFFVKQKIV
ncbi:emp24/gp25L/p24 family protein ASCRUDRAFT_32494 [Ascoidea rubescens DSM 1968]|uniref:GOLD domain-containing protein n=1 Tax=Ascoidea rubescens DSM 1968 TaxID=1344418 RepID=A0A1D2VLA8_9ASCO|nr:hypothetical protein ASCRUDRAFT_32494 [Ascoidea rubescens DSM 1968]ODV62317.1 hypothetical protein ASCRUDRAFT_32494 [Ascoidea rubescens DSM 1968]